MDFNIDILGGFELFGIQIWITRTMVNTWIIMFILILLALVVRLKLRSFKEVPGKFQNVIEALIETFDNFMKNTGGEKLKPLASWFFTIFVFIFLSNISGLVGLRPPTADWATTFALALATFILIHYMGVRHRGGKYIKSFFEPNPIFLPLNLMGELAVPISLSFRLFGNVLSGLILMTLIYNIAPLILQIGIPAALHAYFDIFTGAIQTYIFCALSIMFVKGAAE